ncbi:TonB-dependent receptor [Bradyrhizobium oligotrophicum]|uniref:TonB-dependent receptor n=1 Tax=Bradyrhizobium oligotrophicum TaxID=44255 RepID=UPI003EBABCD1
MDHCSTPVRRALLRSTTVLTSPALLAFAVSSPVLAQDPSHARSGTTLPQVTVTVPQPRPAARTAVRRRGAHAATTNPAVAPAPQAASSDGIAAPPGATSVAPGDILAKRATTSDAAALFADVPGVSLYSAGGVSSLPAIHGLADDRLRIKVDGMDTIASCPNHMNPALSYIDPAQVAAAKVWAGITPVSVGGDSIGGTVAVSSPAALFAAPGQSLLTKGSIGTFYRSNGNVRGVNLSATMATENYSVSYSGAAVKADNYTAGGNFKNFTLRSSITPVLPLDQVGSSAYETRNHLMGVAWSKDGQLIELKAGVQEVPYQLYPNQRMDMLGNDAYSVNLHHLGRFDWGDLDTRLYHQSVDHYMNFGGDRLFSYGTLKPPNTTGASYPVNGMPMYTRTKTNGLTSKADITLSPRDVVRVGVDLQTYRLDDWWPPAPDCGVGNCIGGMAPLTFWNINGGKRDRAGVFSEWEAKWSPSWLSLLGVRFERVETDTGPVVGYNTSTTPLTSGFMSGMYETSSVGSRAAFNAMDRSRKDNNIDLTALFRNTPSAHLTFEFGAMQKTRSPNLYERYSWSRNTMALEMNNFVGDGNGYLGNPDLRPEVAHTVSFTGAWHSADHEAELRLTPYYTHVRDYIDAVQWKAATNTAAVPAVANQFVIMKYMNQQARLYGFDLSGKVPLGSTPVGDFGLKGVLSYTNGRNLDTGSGLYNIMPINGKLTLTHRLDGWDSGLELVMVGRKSDVSVARNELKTPGYSLVNLRSNYTWQKLRISFGVENLFNKLYYLPLGGAYVGEGASMSFNKEAGTIAATGGGVSGTATMWGTAVPGPGRSFYLGANLEF